MTLSYTVMLWPGWGRGEGGLVHCSFWRAHRQVPPGRVLCISHRWPDTRSSMGGSCGGAGGEGGAGSQSPGGPVAFLAHFAFGLLASRPML